MGRAPFSNNVRVTVSLDRTGSDQRNALNQWTDPFNARTLAALKKHGWDRKAVFPHGGNRMTLAIVGGFGLGGCEAYRGVFGVFAGFADDAKVESGFLKLPDRPGVGFEGQNALYAVMKELTP